MKGFVLTPRYAAKRGTMQHAKFKKKIPASHIAQDHVYFDILKAEV
jgi:hypothetical protein